MKVTNARSVKRAVQFQVSNCVFCFDCRGFVYIGFISGGFSPSSKVRDRMNSDIFDTVLEACRDFVSGF